MLVPAPLPIEHLDEDWAVPCERYAASPPPCESVAEWIAWTVRCCPDRMIAVPLCTGHKDEVLMGASGTCGHCGWTFEPCYVGFRLIEPLNRRTT